MFKQIFSLITSISYLINSKKFLYEKWFIVPEKKTKFEDKIKELETIINELENGDVDLDESIKKYTNAMKLVGECDSELKSVEKQVSKLVEENGTIEDFEIEE